MKGIVSGTKLALILSWIIVAILCLLPFHAFLTVWLASLAGHYTALRLWKEFLLIILVAGGLFVLATDTKLRKEFISSLIAQLIIFYSAITIIWGSVAYALNKVTLKALGYGLIVNLRFLIFFLVVWIIAAKSPLLKRIWPKILLIPAALVVVFGLLQRVVLPYDFLKHFGYSASTIYPYETINHNINYPRIMSTLRGANPLGAYLIVILSALTVLNIKVKKQRWLKAVFIAGSALVLILSYSRSAWIGALLSLLMIAWICLKNEQLKIVLLAGALVILLVGAAAAWTLRHNAAFENVVFHTQTNSSIKTTSDQGHAAAFKNGLHDVVHQPLGMGTGTAGPASVYNANKARFAENYYLQIGQEVGVLGLATFIAINILVALKLWNYKDEPLAQLLLASLIGITFVNLLSHAWTDDTLAYIWWGLAGIALTPILTDRQKAHGKKHKTES
jgi:hypothetical protein